MAREFRTLYDIIKSPLVSLSDKKRAVSCYRRVVDKAVNTSVTIGNDSHIYEVHVDKTVQYMKTLDCRQHQLIQIDMSDTLLRLFGPATEPLTKKDKNLATQQAYKLKEAYPHTNCPAFALQSDELSCDNCGCVLTKARKCGRCKCAMYCSKNCQVEDWPLHQVLCE